MTTEQHRKAPCTPCKGSGSISYEDAGYHLYDGGEFLWHACDRDGCDDGKLYFSILEYSQLTNPQHEDYDERVAYAEVLHRDEDDDVVEVECPTCDGKGGYTSTCDNCHEHIEARDYFHTGDGAIYCENCGPSTDCPECKGEGEKQHGPHEFTDSAGKKRTFRSMPVGHDCSCCGARAANKGDSDRRSGFQARDFSWFVWEAPLMDTDRVYYSKLCGDEDGENGCLADMLEQQHEIDAASRTNLDEMVELMPSEVHDGVRNMVQDMPSYFDGSMEG